MKKRFLLSVITVCLASTGWANTKPDTNGDPEPDKKDEGITFSLSKGYFSFFNLFQVEEQKVDSLKVQVPLREESTWDFEFPPLWP